MDKYRPVLPLRPSSGLLLMNWQLVAFPDRTQCGDLVCSHSQQGPY